MYAPLSPISYVRVGAPVATNFWKLPTTWPLVRDTLPVAEVAMNLGPVVTLPDVNVSVPLTVVFTPLSTTPPALSMFSELKVVEFEPPIVWVPVPLNVNVLVPAVNVPLLLKLPLTMWLDDAAPNVVPGPSVKLPLTVRFAAAVADAVPDIVKLPWIVMGVAGIVFVPLVLRLRCPYVSAVTV